MNNKLLAYLGFASKARKILTGYNTCLMEINKHRIKLVIVANDISNNSKDKIFQECKKSDVDCLEFSTKDELSHLTGNIDKGIYGVTDSNFAKIIKNEIEKVQFGEEAKKVNENK